MLAATESLRKDVVKCTLVECDSSRVISGFVIEGACENPHEFDVLVSNGLRLF
jgi:hypothetical protein